MYGESISNAIDNFSKEYISYYCKIAEIKEYQILKCLPIVASRRLYDNNICDNDISRQESYWLRSLIY